MIWNPKQMGATPLPAIEDLVEELSALCGATLGDDIDKLADVAVAVEATLEEQASDVAQAPGMVVALASKALWAIGETRAARRLGLLGAGVILPTEWNVAGGATMWVVDLRPLWPRDGVLMELQVLGSLDMVLDCMADVWDDSDGRGILGLRHLEDVASRMNRRKSGRRAWESEILAGCAARLRTIGAMRGWRVRPDLMALHMSG